MPPARRPRPPAGHQPSSPARRPRPVRLRPRRRRHRRRPLRPPAALAAVAALAALAVPAAPAGAEPGPVAHRPPVEAPVVDPFRPPAGPYAAGNRGIEYGTEPGTAVRASAGGRVAFAGAVGGALHVTVRHDDGVRTSYSFLATIGVVAGQRVAPGERLGTAGPRLHFGARRGDAYFDPTTLFAATPTAAELLPLAVPRGTGAHREAAALAELALAGPGWRAARPGPAAGAGWLRAGAAAGAGFPVPLRWDGGMAADLAERLLPAPPCAAGPPPRRPVAAQRRVAVTVAGLGSSSTAGSIDDLRVGDLGYHPDRVVGFSYAGGRVPTTGAALEGIPAAPYAPQDTHGDLVAAGERLADLIEAVAAADPAALVDVYGHSLGGVVGRLALAALHERGFDLGRLGVAVTLGSPHRGAAAATAVVMARARLGPRIALEVAGNVLGTAVDPGALAIGQLAESSGTVTRLAAAGVPPGVRLVSIAARGDLVVAAPRTHVAGATNITVPLAGPGAHRDLVGSDAATAAMARALAGEPPGCETWGDAVADVVAGHAVAAVEHHLVALVAGPAGRPAGSPAA